MLSSPDFLCLEWCDDFRHKLSARSVALLLDSAMWRLLQVLLQSWTRPWVSVLPNWWALLKSCSLSCPGHRSLKRTLSSSLILPHWTSSPSLGVEFQLASTYQTVRWLYVPQLGTTATLQRVYICDRFMCRRWHQTVGGLQKCVSWQRPSCCLRYTERETDFLGGRGQGNGLNAGSCSSSRHPCWFTQVVFSLGFLY